MKFHPFTQLNCTFCDETGLIKTSGNTLKIYGSMLVRHACNRNAAMCIKGESHSNLMHSITGVDLYNILDGQSSGMEF